MRISDWSSDVGSSDLDAVVFGSGYLANVGTIPVLAGRGDLILVDKFAHACILDGAQISGADMLRLRHNDMAHLADHLATHRARSRRSEERRVRKEGGRTCRAGGWA